MVLFNSSYLGTSYVLIDFVIGESKMIGSNVCLASHPDYYRRTLNLIMLLVLNLLFITVARLDILNNSCITLVHITSLVNSFWFLLQEKEARDIEIPNIRWEVFELMMR